MKKMKKILISGVAAMLAAANLFGATSCFGGGDDSSGGNANVNVNVEAYNGEKVTVTFWHTMGAALTTVLKDHIAEFNKIYPNIKIEQKSQGDYDTLLSLLNTKMSAGLNNLPTMAYCYSDHVASYNASKAVVTLDEYISSTLTVTGTNEVMGLTETQIADYVDAYYDEGKQFGDGKMYMLPFAKSTEVLFYNKDYFEANELKVPATWDEMETLCARILEIDTANKTNWNDKTGKTLTIPLGYDSEANWFITMCEQQGSGYTSMEAGNHFVFNNEENRAFVKEFTEWYGKQYVTTKECYGSYTSDLFTAQDCYMSIGSTGGTGYNIPGLEEGSGSEASFEVGIAPIPQVSTDPTKHKVISQGPSVCLFKKSAQEVAAGWLFLKYLNMSHEFQAEFSMQSGYAPVIESVAEFPAYKTFLANAGNGNANLKATCVKQNIAQKDACYVSDAFTGSAKAREQVGLLMQNAFINGSKKSGSALDAYIQEQFDISMRTLNKYN